MGQGKITRAAQVRTDVGRGGFHTVANTHSAQKGTASRHSRLHLQYLLDKQMRLIPHACLGRGPGAEAAAFYGILFF